MIELRRSSALEAATPNPFAADGFGLRELPGVAIIRVQALRGRGLHATCVDPALLPDTPNTTTGIDPVALWKAPDDWIVYSETVSAEQLSDRMRGTASPAPLVVTDISSASVAIEISGPRALDVLMTECTLDLEGQALGPGACAQTPMAQTRVLLHRPVESAVYRLFVERSVAMHVWAWLTETARQDP